MTEPVKTVLFSTLYPSSERPGHGVFVETRLRHLLATGRVRAKVVAPVPWFPSRHPRFGDKARMARTPRRETWHGIDVLHPRYPVLPKVGMHLAPVLLAAACLPVLRRLIAEGHDFDVIDAHYYYPDGVAAAWLGRRLGKPVAITARGSDLNLIARHPLPRRMMRWAASRAAASIGVCNALVDVLRGWGVRESSLHVMRNGVDLELFRPPAGDAPRPPGPLVLSVGNLVELKGHDLVLRAVAALLPRSPGLHLVVLGEGPERQRLEALTRELGVEHAVTLPGARPQAELSAWYGAADVLVLASSREGWANVLLESMACGTPVVATRVGGTVEVVASRAAGQLVDERSAAAIAAAIGAVLAAPPARGDVRSYAEGFSWDETSRAQAELFQRLSGRSAETARA